MDRKEHSTSGDLDIVRAAGEGMTKRHSEEGDKRQARAAKKKKKAKKKQ
ncbi:MAG TPA: hypothetical protein VMH91_00520 [Candidatus Paceibacterota bacterium]|nr:hypothetical protein [Candidatus Paceibacterota bacterium]